MDWSESMNFLSQQITFKEIPSEVCLSILITGCPVRCKDCNSKDSWDLNAGQKLELEFLSDLIKKKRDWITCVLFLGGEWHPEELVELLKYCKSLSLKTALFSGLDMIDPHILQFLDYVKTGPYIKELGGLDNPRTNQKLINLRAGTLLTHFKEEQSDSIK